MKKTEATEKKTPKVWTDETGMIIPLSRITETEKLKEKSAKKLLKEAESINKKLTDYKKDISEICHQLYMEVMAENKVEGAKPPKGNFTWFNFDRSIKVETSVSEKIGFDDLLIAAAKEKLDSFISENTNSVEQMIKSLIMEAFSTSKGKMDSKKVMSLVKYKTRIDENKYPLFHEAIKLIEKSIIRPDSKTYYRIFKKSAEGKYESVELNFSFI